MKTLLLLAASMVAQGATVSYSFSSFTSVTGATFTGQSGTVSLNFGETASIVSFVPGGTIDNTINGGCSDITVLLNGTVATATNSKGIPTLSQICFGGANPNPPHPQYMLNAPLFSINLSGGGSITTLPLSQTFGFASLPATITQQISFVPEPSTASSALLGLLAIAIGISVKHFRAFTFLR